MRTLRLETLSSALLTVQILTSCRPTSSRPDSEVAETENAISAKNTTETQLTGPLSPEETAQKCLVEDLRRRIVVLQFEAQQKDTCPWASQEANGSDGNLPMKDDHFTARRSQMVALPIGRNEVFCGLELTSNSQEFRYEDEALLSFNDIMLASSINLKEVFPSESSLTLFDWSTLAGLSREGKEKAVTCYGSNGDQACVLPGKDGKKNLQISLAPETLVALITRAHQQDRYELQLTITGDTDELTDCQHTGLEMEVKYFWYPKDKLNWKTLTP